MALITPQKIKDNTSMGGEVDPDKFMHLLNDVEVTVLEPLLGTKLYDKIVTDYDADTLTGDYLEMFNKYIEPVLWHSVYADYLREGRVLAMNTGIFSNAPENASAAPLEEVIYNVKNAQSKADVYISRLERYLCDKNIPEYDEAQEEDYDLKPREVRTIGGWHLSDAPKNNEWGIGE